MTSITTVDDEVYETGDPSLLVAQPLVSVIVLTYNHERFLREAVASVVSQIAPFPFEIVIAEDHSTDGTLKVAMGLQREHPRIVRVIHGPANLGANPNILRAVARSRGKYIAICEGDDYWSDPQKLARQIEKMAERPEVGMCFTHCSILSPDGTIRQPARALGAEEHIVSVSELLNHEVIYIPTASMVWRGEKMRGMPEWFNQAPIGDLFCILAGATPNGALYLPSDTVVYRAGVSEGWTEQYKKNWDMQKVEHSRRRLWAYEQSVISFGLSPRVFWRIASSARYILLRDALARGAYREALAHLVEIKPSYLLRLFRRRLFGSN